MVSLENKIMENQLKIVVLISCMFQDNEDIIRKSNVQTDVIVINQCDKDEVKEFYFQNRRGVKCHAKFINTTERGLSRSRNMAIKNAWGDICYICDDDEILEDDFEEIVARTYGMYNQDVIIFAVNRKDHNYPSVEQKVSIRQILRTSSVQTTFKRLSIISKNIVFDELMGSGTGNGAGEENKFLMDCRRAGLNIYYIPKVISTVTSEASQWFDGFTEKYFVDTGWAAKRILGAPIAFLYLVYWSFIRSRSFDISFSKLTILKLFLKGFFDKR